MEAIVLGGGITSGAMKAVGGTLYEAGIPINNRPMVEYVIKVLEEMEEIEKVLVVIPPGIITAESWAKVEILPPGELMIDSLVQAVQYVRPADHVLVVASDIPLITKEAIRDFLARCRQRTAEVYYPFVPKRVVRAKYPTTKRTYVRLKEETVTGGNVFLVQPRILLAYRDRIEQAIALRKHPIKLCRLLGLNFLVKFFTGQLRVAEIEARVEEILQVRGAGILSLYPEIGVDVDKPSDLLLARSILAQE